MNGKRDERLIRLTAQLARAAACLAAPSRPGAWAGALRLGIDLGTSDVVSILVDRENTPIAVCLDWADVVRDGIVWDFFGAVDIVRRQHAKLRALFDEALPRRASTSFPPGTEARISANVIEAAGLEVAGVIDEPSAVADMLALDEAAVVDIGGGTTGVAIVRGGKIVYSADEPTGGHHVSLTLAGHYGIPLEAAETMKKTASAERVWPVVQPVFEKMAAIVAAHLRGHRVSTLYFSGGSCMLPGVRELFARAFPDLRVILPKHALFLTPLAIAAYGQEARP